jgi:hypothetical protein
VRFTLESECNIAELARPDGERLNDIREEERSAQLRVKYLSAASGDDLPAKGTFLVV